MNSPHSGPIVTRFAPSPTGLLHAGNYRTALFSYLFARQNKGKFIVRIEDTDRERSKKEYEENILESLKWLGLEYDAFYRQSEQLEEHKKALTKLIDTGAAYISKEEAKDGSGRIVEVVRFKNPNIKVTFKDLIRGEITTDTTDLKDFVIAKNINEPLFHLAVVVDDITMGITHVVRGEDHIANTPRQILIQRALGASEPIYAHLPLILAPDRTKLSKRRGALAITEYRDRGYSPDAIVNYMALLGWNPGTDQEILSRAELISKFDISKIQKGGAIFDEKKLRWINKHYIASLPHEVVFATFKKYLKDVKPHCEAPDALLERLYPVITERIEVMGDIKTMLEQGDFVYFFEKPTYKAESLLWKDEKDPAKATAHLDHALKAFSALDARAFASVDTVKAALWDYAEAQGRGNVLWPLRYALSGAQKSPDPFTLAHLLGKDETCARISDAIKILS